MSYGVYSTWLLALVYLPIRKTLSDVGQDLADALLRHSRVPHLHWKQWFEERQAWGCKAPRSRSSSKGSSSWSPCSLASPR